MATLQFSDKELRRKLECGVSLWLSYIPRKEWTEWHRNLGTFVAGEYASREITDPILNENRFGL